MRFELDDDDVNRRKRRVHHYYRVGDHAAHVQFLGALWSITEGEDKLEGYEEDGDVSEDGEDVFTHIVAERVDFGICKGASNEVEGEIEVGKGEEGEEE